MTKLSMPWPIWWHISTRWTKLKTCSGVLNSSTKRSRDSLNNYIRTWYSLLKGWTTKSMSSLSSRRLLMSNKRLAPNPNLWYLVNRISASVKDHQAWAINWLCQAISWRWTHLQILIRSLNSNCLSKKNQETLVNRVSDNFRTACSSSLSPKMRSTTM